MADVLEGYGAVWNTEAVISGLFRERILRGAFAETIKRDDIRASFNHNLDHLLGRRVARTLTLTEDSKGLLYRIVLNNQDPTAMSVAAKVARGDVTGSSFWFVPASDEDEEWERGGPGQLPLRTLKRLRLIEVGPVALPAYTATSASARDSLAELAALRIQIEHVRLQAQIDDAKAWRAKT